jgi:hypothetical protein
LTLTYSKPINDVTDNAMILKICGAVAEKLEVPYNRITDSYGGYYGYTSPDLPKTAPVTPAAKPATPATNTTKAANKTRVLATNTTTANTTATTPKSYPINIYV